VTSSPARHCTLGVTKTQSKLATIHHSNIWLLSVWALASRWRGSYTCSLREGKVVRCALFRDTAVLHNFEPYRQTEFRNQAQHKVGKSISIHRFILCLIWGVCILLRVWYRMIWVLIRLRNVDIVWWYITYIYIATCFGRTTIIRLENIATLGLLNWQRIRCFIRSHIIVIVYILLCIIWYSVVMGDVFSSVCIFSVPLHHMGHAFLFFADVRVSLVAGRFKRYSAQYP
jgi:hypothetical protein